MRYRTNEDISSSTAKSTKKRYRTDTERFESVSSKQAETAKDIALGTLFMNPARIARGISTATGNEMSGGAKKALGWISKIQGVDIGQGFFGAAEGITDFLAGGAAQIAGQKDAAKWIYEHSWSRDAVGADVTDEYVGDAAETKGYRLASDLLSGVGNVGFQVAVGTLIGGALAAPVANGAISQAGARAISFAPLFASASGAGTAENIAKTGELGWRENVGGLLKGGVEVLTEVVSPTGKIVDRAINGKSAGSIFRYLSKHAVAKNIIVDFASEAGEEMASYAGGWFIENKLKISDEAFSARDMVYQGVLGGITGAIFAAPSDISLVRSARSSGAKVYAQGDAAVKNKINEGLIEVKLLKERGLNNDNVKLAEAALAKLTTDENLSQTTKEYYLGLAEQMVLKQNLSDKYNALAKELVAKAKADPATAQSMADAFNALVNEAGGEGKYTAADFTNENSEAARIYVVAQMANDWLSRSDAETAMDEIMRRKAALYQGTAEQKNAIRSMQDGSTVAFRVGENAYAVVTKREGTNTYSVGFTTPGQVESDGAVYATHNLSAEKVEELLSKPMTEQQIDSGIVDQIEKRAKAEAQKKARAEARKKAKTEAQEKAETKPTTETTTTENKAEATAEAQGKAKTEQTAKKTKPKAKKTEAKTEGTQKKKAETENKGKKKTPAEAKKAGEKASLSPAATKTVQTEQTTEQAQTETTEKKVKPEDLSTVEKRLTSAFGIDGSEFTKEEWTKARECVPNIDGLGIREQARVLTLIRTAQAHGVNEDYYKGLARMSSVYGFGVVFEDIDVSGFYSRKNGMVVINPNNLDETYGHEIKHTFDQVVKDGKAEFRADLSEKVKKIVGASVFDKAKAQYKADYDKLRARDGSVAELSDAELEAEATANVVGKYLSNMTLLKKLAATDYSLGRGLLAAIRRMKDKWTSAKAFAKENDSTAFAEYRRMTRIENLLMKELGYNRQIGTARNGVAIDRNGRVSFNVTTYGEKVIEVGRDKDNKPILKSGREILEETFRKNGHAEADIKATLDQLDKVYKAMKDLGKDYQYLRDWNEKGLEYNLDTGSLVFSSMVKNGEYEINFDFTTVCKHREAFTKVLEELVRMNKAEEVTLTAQRIVEINTILTKHGLQTACTMCFVESRRNNIRKWAISFVDGKPATKKVPKRMGWNDIVRSVYGDDVQYADFSKEEVEDDTKGVDIDSASDMMKQDMAKSEDLAQILSEREDAEQDPEAAAKNTEAKMKRLIKSNKRYAFLIRESDLYGTVGVSAIKRNYPEMYSILLQSYGVATPKITLPAAPYANELGMLKSENYKSLKIDGKTMKFSLGEYTKRIGGARLQSFSDYQMLRFLDYCQLVADAQANGCAIQCYTKEIDMVHLFGLTGMKINMSLVPYVHDSTKTASLGKDYAGLVVRPDGTFDYAIANESIPWKETYTEKGVTKHGAFWYQNQEGYKQNVGTILIGVSKYQILKALADPNIRMIIPYHASGMAKGLQMAYHIDGFEDYTSLQHTRKFNGEKWVNVTKKEEFDFYEAYLRLNGDAKAACLEYLQYCDEHGYRPKFFDASPATEGFVYNKTVSKGDKYVFTDKNGNKLSMNENYYKMIEDFSCYDGDGNVIQQGTVKLALPEDWGDIVIRGLTEAGEQNALLQREMQPILDEVQATAKESSKKEKTYKKLGEEYYKAKQEQIVPGVSDTSLSPAPVSSTTDSDGRKLTTEQESFFKNSKVRDENGRLMVMYHGTRAFGFTVFDPKKSNDKMSLFFTNNPKVAAGYSNGEALGFSRTSTAVADVTKDTVLPDKKAPKITDTKEAADYLNSLGCNVSSYTTTAYGREIEHFSYTDALDHRRIYGVTKTEFLNYANSVRRNGVDSRAAYKVYLNLTNPLVINCDGHNWNYIYYDVLKDKNTVKWDGHTTREIAEWAKKNGYDGIVFKDIYDNGAGTKNRPQLVEKSTVCVAFKSNQIKSVGNETPTSNPDIRYSPAPSGSGRIVIQASQSRPTGREKLTNLKGELSRSNFRAALESLQVIAVNAQQGVENQLVRAGLTKREAAAFSQLARSGRSHAINAICYKLADMTGAIRSEGLIPILEPFLATKGEVYPAVDKDGNTVQSTAKGGELAGKRYSEFSDYYAMLHAIDRAAVGKNPYSSMTVAQMKQIVAEYEQKNPDFKAAAEKLSAFNSAMLDIEVQAGIISQETADLWRKQYPHYVPMYTQDSNAVGGKPVRGARNMEVRRDNAAATESDHRVSDPLRNYIDQVQRRIRAAKLNILLNEVYNSADGVNVVTAEADRAEAKDLREREQAYLENLESENDPAEMFRKFKRGKNTVNEVSFYKDGKRVTMAVTDRIYTGLSDLGGIHSSILDSWTVKAVKKVNDTFKKLVTNWNPFFAVKNIARDLQDGTLQSRFGMGEFLNMYRKNAEMMATGKYNDMWEEFLANGGLESSLYSDEFGTFTKGGKSGLEQATGIVGQFQHVKNFNTLTEALPRFTEYCLTRKHGGSVQTALLNAADVTVNFGRSGTLIRILNSTVSPFLNPAVQGLDRVIRLFTEDGIKNNKALASLLLKAVLLAIVPMALGNAMYGDDDEYKDMKDSIKENNYLFKVGDTWLKLPRGRVVSTISGLFNRSYKQLTGQETDWGDYGKNVLDQITPAQNVARHIGSPFYDVANNRTWYGTKIESDALQNYAVNQRYDENTSRISVWIGQLTSHFGLSPKEVNYLIDQYTGVVGDILLPTTTPAGTKGVASYNFTVDPNTSSNLSNRFYDLYNNTMYKSNDGDIEAYYLKKRLDETKSAVSELFKEIKAINADSSLSNKEKVKQASAIRASINQLYKTALDDRRLYEQNIKDALAIENSYAVEKITAQSAKRYGLDSDAVGKYALTFGGEFVKKYDTEAQANDYKADASKKTVYAEANRLTYGSEYALREYSSTVYEKAQKLNELGISYDEYYNYYMTARYYSGKTKKDKILAYLNGSGLSKSQIALMMYYSGYSAYADEAKKAIKASALSAERKKELLAGITN